MTHLNIKANFKKKDILLVSRGLQHQRLADLANTRLLCGINSKCLLRWFLGLEVSRSQTRASSGLTFIKGINPKFYPWVSSNEILPCTASHQWLWMPHTMLFPTADMSSGVGDTLKQWWQMAKRKKIRLWSLLCSPWRPLTNQHVTEITYITVLLLHVGVLLSIYLSYTKEKSLHLNC